MIASLADHAVSYGSVLRLVLGQVLTPRWRLMTAVAVVACATTIALGFWQLGRLQQRRALSALLSARVTPSPVALTGDERWSVESLDALQYRQVRVRGRFDFDHEVAVVNAVSEGEIGFRLLTPLVVTGSDRAVLVDRGWIPAAGAGHAGVSRSPGGGLAAGNRQPPTVPWLTYRPDDQAGEMEILGWVRMPPPGRAAPLPIGPERLVPGVDLRQMEAFTGRTLAPFYVMQSPAADHDAASLPRRAPPPTDLGDGVHLIAATQWFAISAIIVVGYFAYIYQHSVRPPGAPRSRYSPG